MLQKSIGLLFFLCSVAFAAEDTLLKLYRPYGEATGQVSPQVKKTIPGVCYAQSQLIIREDAWRCIAEGKTYDPCFVKSGLNRKEALCPKSPWNGESVQILVKDPLNNDQNIPLDMSLTYPWAIELTNGEHCDAINSGEIYDNMPVRYQCAKKHYLVGHLQRCKPTWSMLEKTPKGIETVELSKAWF